MAHEYFSRQNKVYFFKFKYLAHTFYFICQKYNHNKIIINLPSTIGAQGFDSRKGLRNFLFSTVSRPVVPPPASYPMGSGGSFPEGKATGS